MRKNLQKKKILVIAHDAGGGEIIAAYVKANLHKNDFYCYARGPALNVFLRERISCKQVLATRIAIARLIKKHRDVNFVLLGTGWMTKIESFALAEAKLHGLRCAVYLESWSGFRERFGYPSKNWKENLPDEIWVGDKPALLLAGKFFKTIKVRYVPNQYFAYIKKRYRLLRKNKTKPSDILFLSDAVPGTEKIFEDFLLHLPPKSKPYDVRVRFHPADDRSRYDEIITRVSGTIVIKKSKEKDLVRDLSLANVVVGTETVAMVGAVLAGKKTLSIVLLGNKKATLPFAGITRVNTGRAAARLI